MYENVGGLEIAVDDPHRVDRREPFRELQQNVEREPHLAVATLEAEERVPLDELHHDEDEARARDVHVDDRHDVRVIHVRRELRLAGEARHVERAGDAAQDFHRKVFSIPETHDLVDRSHRTGADLARELVTSF